MQKIPEDMEKEIQEGQNSENIYALLTNLDNNNSNIKIQKQLKELDKGKIMISGGYFSGYNIIKYIIKKSYQET